MAGQSSSPGGGAGLASGSSDVPAPGSSRAPRLQTDSSVRGVSLRCLHCCVRDRDEHHACRYSPPSGHTTQFVVVAANGFIDKQFIVPLPALANRMPRTTASLAQGPTNAVPQSGPRATGPNSAAKHLPSSNRTFNRTSFRRQLLRFQQVFQLVAAAAIATHPIIEQATPKTNHLYM